MGKGEAAMGPVANIDILAGLFSTTRLASHALLSRRVRKRLLPPFDAATGGADCAFRSRVLSTHKYAHELRLGTGAARGRRMPSDSAEVAAAKSTARSRVSNGSAILPGVDGRSVWARRFRDLMELHVSDKGGPDAVSEAERSIIRRAAALEVELERLEAKFATSGEAAAADLDLYGRTSNTLRRHLEAVGLQRRAKDVTPTLDAYLRAKAGEGQAA